METSQKLTIQELIDRVKDFAEDVESETVSRTLTVVNELLERYEVCKTENNREELHNLENSIRIMAVTAMAIDENYTWCKCSCSHFAITKIEEFFKAISEEVYS